MINKIAGYDEAKVSTNNFETLPKGGYVLCIADTEVCYTTKGRQYIKLSCEIAEGEYMNFFTRDFESNHQEDKRWRCTYNLFIPEDNDEAWKIRNFKRDILRFEESNPGFHWDWDEKKLEALLVGGLFNEKEYEKQNGEIGKFTNLKRLDTIDNIRNNKFKLPEDELLTKPAAAKVNTNAAPVDDF